MRVLVPSDMFIINSIPGDPRPLLLRGRRLTARVYDRPTTRGHYNPAIIPDVMYTVSRSLILQLTSKRTFTTCTSFKMATNGTTGVNGAARQKQTLENVKNKSLLHYAGYINGEWVEKAHSGKTFDVIDPATLEKIATMPEMEKKETAEAVQAAHNAFKSYKKTTARERARMMRKWYDVPSTIITFGYSSAQSDTHASSGTTSIWRTQTTSP